jgi:ketosteroid isomerase-like protein
MTDQTTLSPAEVLGLADDAFNDGDMDRAAGLVAPDAADYTANDGTVPGTAEHVEAWNRRRRAFASSIPDLSRTIHRTVESGDTIGQLMVIRGTMNGRPLESSAIHIVRVRDGKIAEHWLVAEPFQAAEPVSPGPAEVVRMATEAFLAGFPEEGSDVLASDAVDHSVDDGSVPGTREHVEAWERRRRALRDRMSDVTITIEQSIENGDTVGQLLTTRGTLDGGPFESCGFHIVRVRQGRIVEHWAVVEPRVARGSDAML